MGGQVPGAGRGPDLGPPAQRAVDVAKEVGALEPPVPEQLGVERRHDHAVPALALGLRDPAQQPGEMIGVTARAVERRAGS